MTELLEGEVQTVHKAGTYQFDEEVDTDIIEMSREWDLVDLAWTEHRDLSELRLVERLTNTVEISTDGPDDGIDVFVTSPLGGSRVRREISLLLDDDVREGEEISIRARRVGDSDVWVPLEESPLVRLSFDSEYRDLDSEAEVESDPGRMDLDLDMPVAERINGELLRLWRRYRDRTRARVDR